MKSYVGLDVSLKETAICVVDETGNFLREGTAPSTPEDIAAWLAELNMPIERVGLEAGALARWLYLELQAQALPMVCIAPPAPPRPDQDDAGQDRPQR